MKAFFTTDTQIFTDFFCANLWICGNGFKI